MSQVRTPRLKLIVAPQGGQPQELTGNTIISAEVSTNGYFQADTFRAEISLNGNSKYGLAYWDALPGSGEAATPVTVEIMASLDGHSFSQLIVGEIDHFDADLPQGVLSISGRDLTRRLIDAKTTQTFQNQTASQIVEQICAMKGIDLTPIVTPTTTLAGRFYQIDHDRVTAGQFSRATTYWDLLSYLARDEGFVCFVSGFNLYFGPQPTPSTPALTVNWDNTGRTSNVIGLRLGRSLTLASDVIVAVRSWNSRHGAGYTAYSPYSKRSAIASGSAQLYSFTRPNLTQDAAQKLADKMRADITAHERTVTFSMPGDLTLNPHSAITVSGDVGSWAQGYFVDRVTRHISFENGFTQTVSAKNASPASQTLI